MKRLFVRFGVALASVGLIAGTGVASASPPPPAGYVTKTVKDAGLTVAVPETFTVVRATRKQAKAILDENPQLRRAGATVDSLRHLRRGLISAAMRSGSSVSRSPPTQKRTPTCPQRGFARN